MEALFHLAQSIPALRSSRWCRRGRCPYECSEGELHSKTAGIGTKTLAAWVCTLCQLPTPPLSRGQALVRLVDRSAAQKVRIDLVLGMPLAGVPLRPDCPQPELPHQPPHASAADRNPIPQQRDLQPAAAVDRIVGENPVEPLQKLEFRRRFRPRPVIEAC